MARALDLTEASLRVERARRSRAFAGRTAIVVTFCWALLSFKAFDQPYPSPSTAWLVTTFLLLQVGLPVLVAAWAASWTTRRRRAESKRITEVAGVTCALERGVAALLAWNAQRYRGPGTYGFAFLFATLPFMVLACLKPGGLILCLYALALGIGPVATFALLARRRLVAEDDLMLPVMGHLLGYPFYVLPLAVVREEPVLAVAMAVQFVGLAALFFVLQACLRTEDSRLAAVQAARADEAG
jgi:hypothetical protein